MTITAADIKIGMCIEMDGKTLLVVDFQHCKPGKGPAFVRSKLKNLENGRVLENTFSSVSQKIEQVRVERRPYQFTYEDDLGAHFMHTETFEEINIDRNLINNYDLITDGQIVEVMFHTEKEIRTEVERVMETFRKGRFLPAMDHQTPPGTPIENYRTYISLMKEYGAEACRG